MHAPLAVFLLRLVGLALACAATLAAYGMAESALARRYPAFLRLEPGPRRLAAKNALKAVVLSAGIPVAALAVHASARGVGNGDNAAMQLAATMYASQDVTALALLRPHLSATTVAHHATVLLLWTLLAAGALEGVFGGAVWLCCAALPTGVVNLYIAARQVAPAEERRALARASVYAYLPCFAFCVLHQTLALRAATDPVWVVAAYSAALGAVWRDDVVLLRHLLRAAGYLNARSC